VDDAARTAEKLSRRAKFEISQVSCVVACRMQSLKHAIAGECGLMRKVWSSLICILATSYTLHQSSRAALTQVRTMFQPMC
jgi:hypothetical protein